MKSILRSCLWATLLLLITGCVYTKVNKVLKGGEVLKTDYLTEVPMTIVHDLPFVEVEISGVTYNFLFDTGAELSVLGSHLTDKVDLKGMKDINAVSASKTKKKVQLITIDKLSFGDVDFVETGAVVADLSHMEEVFGCRPMDGIIGNNLMRRAQWQIDYPNSALRLTDDVARFEIGQEAHAITMDAGPSRNIYFDVTIDGVTDDFLFDTGFSGTISADPAFLDSLMSKRAGRKVYSETGVTGSDLHGMIEGTTHNTIAHSYDIEGLKGVEGLVISKEKSKCLVGSGLFKDYVITLDWTADLAHFDRLTEPMPDVLMSHELIFYPNYVTKSIEVRKLRNDHTLDEPISVGAVVTKIGSTDVSSLSLSELCTYWSATQDSLLLAPTVYIEVLDEGVSKQVTLSRK